MTTKRLSFERPEPAQPLVMQLSDRDRVINHMIDRYDINYAEAAARYRYWEMVEDFRTNLGIK